MKSRLLAIVLVAISIDANSQIWNEWFRQKKTQKKYMVQQIAALKMYLRYLEEGYKVVEKGMGMVGEIKEGNFSSHKEYFSSLSKANILVSGSGKLASIVYYEEAVIRIAQQLTKDLADNHELSPSEIAYIRSVGENLIRHSSTNVEKLDNLLQDGSLEMKDDERIVQLEAIYNNAREKYAFAHQFATENLLLILQRRRQAKQVTDRAKLEGL
jgi:hypothetical protein